MRFRGTVYRAHNPQWVWTPLSGEGARRYGGRFKKARDRGALLLALSTHGDAGSAATSALGYVSPVTFKPIAA